MVSELDKKVIRELQGDLPLTNRPYKEIAERIGISEEKLLEKIEELKAKKIIRRFGAALRHRKMGLTANPMVVWRVPENKVEEAGRYMAQLPQITHCYQRKMLPDWPYNLYMMLHCRTREECEEIVQQVASHLNIDDYQLLYSTAELKKTSMLYFK